MSGPVARSVPALEWDNRMSPGCRLGWHHYRITASKHYRSRSGLRIACAQMTRVLRLLLALQQPLRFTGGKPASIFADSNRNNVIPIAIDGVQHRCRGEK